ncbi:hypothetical protein [Mycolicibacterium hodleri]|uniref:Alanine and proline rich membrane protein n=1 Tax=Mycolicibacterium hodleri TaxID=49897 RepID=A0A502E656_9MYCO|nr:hypothetical protein [Mycolicibacterium hodleri]TPG32302.1 hypothetical protein EAH80_20670 [Mycolicibacterium hodleri]
MSVVAVGLSAWAVLRPAPRSDAESTYTADQRNDAKIAVCAATDVVRKGVSLNTNLQSPGGEGDVVGSLAVAANARLSLSDGGLYLIARLDPATPTELAGAVTKFANTLLDIGAAATAGSPNTDPDQAARLREADTENAKVTDLCR